MPLVFSGHRWAFRSHVAAGSRLHRHDPPLAALRPDALDGGLWLSGWICDLTDIEEWLHTGSRMNTLATELTETLYRSGKSAKEGSH